MPGLLLGLEAVTSMPVTRSNPSAGG
jgi:hypothetical protein